MEKIINSVFRNMTLKEIEEFVSLWERTDIEFWDLVDLYCIE